MYLGLQILAQKGLLGTRNVYLRAIDAAGMDSGWKLVGMWRVYINEPPIPAAMTPQSGSGSGVSGSERVRGYDDPLGPY